MGPHPPSSGLSLCAGAGGLDMGLGLAEPGFHTRCYVEWEEYPRSAIIAAQRSGCFVPAPIWTDLKTFDGRPWRGIIDTVLAGYPCQPFSQAGQRRGEDDPRHLWPDVARIVEEVDPLWVFLENVSGHVSLGAEAVLRTLRDMGYTPAAGLFSAAETGAPHQRLRWFCVAHRDSDQLRADFGKPDATADRRDNTGGRGSVELDDAAGPRRDAARGRPEADSGSGECLPGDRRPELADASGAGPQGRERTRAHAERDRTSAPRSTSERRGLPLFPPGPADAAAWASVLASDPARAPAASRRNLSRAALRAAAVFSPEQAEAVEHRTRDLAGLDFIRAVEWEAHALVEQPEAVADLRQLAAGMAHRTRALRLLGNGVCPISAAHAWRTLAAAHGLGRVDLDPDTGPTETSAIGI